MPLPLFHNLEAEDEVTCLNLHTATIQSLALWTLKPSAANLHSNEESTEIVLGGASSARPKDGEAANPIDVQGNQPQGSCGSTGEDGVRKGTV